MIMNLKMLFKEQPNMVLEFGQDGYKLLQVELSKKELGTLYSD